jgi:hypothetical protein
MRGLLLTLAVCLSLAAAEDYKVEPAGPPPAEIPAAFGALLAKDGLRVPGHSEIWLVAKPPSGAPSTEQAISIPTLPVGSFLGMLRILSRTTDRRGQSLKPGWYTLRYGNFPINGDHQGVAPQRDFFVLSPVEADKSPATTADADAMYNLSRKASGTPHPAVLSFWKEDQNWQAGSIHMEGEHDWVILIIGKAAE